ncbi:DNA gyrase inhibitor YacG [Blastochloris viridis]|nr:DNA gyrase inhibitor YacG [Blastochloris viridis]ALK08537.1 DNA gyrase inhibitor YacG [Blastochloris viridis]CUU41200.1 zinc-binding protein [Blastochloris viridis]
MTKPASDQDKPDTASPSAKPCPICGKPAERRWQPFCSKRCADVDLNRWLTGAYAIPVVENDETPEEEGGTAE